MFGSGRERVVKSARRDGGDAESIERLLSVRSSFGWRFTVELIGELEVKNIVRVVVFSIDGGTEGRFVQGCGLDEEIEMFYDRVVFFFV